MNNDLEQSNQPKSTIPETYITSGHRRAQASEVHWDALKQKAEQATADYQRVLQEAHTDEELTQAKLDYEIANAELERFDVTHDVSGAFSKAMFDRDLFAQADILQSGKSEYPLEDQYLFIVSMGELDRLNKEGGHKGGNLGLQKTVEAIENIVQSELSFLSEEIQDWSKVYTIYRFSGNEFTLKINIPLAKELMQRIRKQLSEARPEVMPGVEPPPLTAREVNLAQCREVIPEAIKQKHPTGEHAEEILNLTKEVLFAISEEEKIASRVRRITDRIFEEEKLDGGDLLSSRSLYEQFLQKSLNGLAFALPNDEEVTIKSFEDVRRVAAYFNTQRDQHKTGEEALQTTTLNEIIYKPALKATMDSVRQQHEKNSGVKERIIAYLKDQDYLRKHGAYGTDVSSELAQAANEIPKFVRNISSTNEEAATTGLQKLKKLENERAQLSVKTIAEPESLQLKKEAQLAQLHYEIASAKQDKATGCGLDNALYRDTQEALMNGKSIVNIGIDMGFLKYFDRAGGKIVGDKAILEAARLFDEAATKNPPGFIDRLRGLNREADAKTYRPGGDEFNIVITGKNIPEADLQKTTEAMKAWILDQAKQVYIEPDPKESRPEYKRSPIVVSLGSEVFLSQEQGKSKLAAANIPLEDLGIEVDGNPLARQNPLAERLFQIADTQLEIQKMYQRFLFLREQADYISDLVGDPAKEKELAEKKEHFEQLVLYSRKALGEGGEKELERLTGIRLKEGKADFANIVIRTQEQRLSSTKERAELLLYVFEREEEKNKQKKQEHGDVEVKIELIARVQFMERQVEALKEELGEAHQEAVSYQQLIKKLEQANQQLKTIAEQSRQESESIKGLRQKIDQTT